MTTIYLVRHGETLENAAQILQGHMPGTLNEKGIQQVLSLKETLAPIHFDALVCSDLKRCIDTANLLNTDRHLNIRTTSLLRERDWGSFTGKYIPDVQKTPIPADVESIEELRKRAQSALSFLRTHYPNQTVLVVSHGLMNRAIQAEYYQKEMRDIERMGNASYVTLQL